MGDWTHPKTLAILKENIARHFTVGQSTRCRFSVTGEEYVVIGDQAKGTATVPGTVDEGMAKSLAFDEETACVLAQECFRRYADTRQGNLYWRCEPTLEWYNNQAIIYMRCLISNKPVVPCRNDREDCCLKEDARRSQLMRETCEASGHSFVGVPVQEMTAVPPNVKVGAPDGILDRRCSWCGVVHRAALFIALGLRFGVTMIKTTPR